MGALGSLSWLQSQGMHAFAKASWAILTESCQLRDQCNTIGNKIYNAHGEVCGFLNQTMQCL